MPKATTIRFTDEMFGRLDQASARTGLPVNSIVVAACLEWLAAHVERTAASRAAAETAVVLAGPPRWATLRRALGKAAARGVGPVYPFEHFTKASQELLVQAQAEAQKRGHAYIGTEHMLLAGFENPESSSAKVLSRLGVDRASVETKLDSLLGTEKIEWRERIVPTVRTKKVIEMAFRLSSTSGDSRVGTHHILMALSKEGSGIAAHILNDLGVTLDRIEREVGLLTEPEP